MGIEVGLIGGLALAGSGVAIGFPSPMGIEVGLIVRCIPRKEKKSICFRPLWGLR